MKALAATQRTIDAIRKADALPSVRPGGVMRKGAYPHGDGGDTYTGYFAATNNGDNTVTIAAGKLKAGNFFVDVAQETVAVTASGFIVLTVTYSTVYVGDVSFVSDLSSLLNGNDVIILHTVTYSTGAITAIDRQISGVALVTGKLV